MTIAIALLAGLLLYVLWDRSKERREWAAERRELLTRIQAPQLAPVMAPLEDAEPPEWVAPGDDEAYEQVLRDRNGSS